MPGAIVAFFVAIGIGAGSALIGPPAIWQGPDPTAKSKFGKPAPVEYMVRVSSPTRDASGCTFTVIAWATRESLRRLVVDGVEQQMDFSWSVEKRVPLGTKLETEIRFIHPVTREEQSFAVSDYCWAIVGG